MPEGYEVLGELGRGAQGTVFRVRQTASGTERALKVLDDKVDPETVIRFRREAEALARLGGRGVVTVHTSGVEEGRLYFIMDLMPKGSLRELLQRGRLEWREAATLVAKLARTIERAATLGLVHRDLKPANVLLDDQGEPRITDWGCARDLSAASLTETGAILGTPAYMAPEQLEGKKVDARADAFALAVILHEALTGEKPFRGRTPIAIFQAMKAGQRPRARASSGCPAAIDALLDRALAVLPERRATAGEIARSLEAALSGKKDELLPISRGRIVAVVAGTLAVLGAALLLAGRGPSDDDRPPPPPPPSGLATGQGRPFDVARVLHGLEGPTPWRVLDAEVAQVGTVPPEARDRVIEAGRARCEAEERAIAKGVPEPAATLARVETLLEVATRVRALGGQVDLQQSSAQEWKLLADAWDGAHVDTERHLRVLVLIASLRRELGFTRGDAVLDRTARSIIEKPHPLGRKGSLGVARDFLTAVPESAWPHHALSVLLLQGEPAEREEGAQELARAIAAAEPEAACLARISLELPMHVPDAMSLAVARDLAARLVRRAPDLAHAHLALGRVLGRSGWGLESDPVRARDELDRALELADRVPAMNDGEKILARLWGASLRDTIAGPDAALAFLDAHTLPPTLTGVRLRVQLLIELDRRPEALEVLEKAVASRIKEELNVPGLLTVSQALDRARAAGDDPVQWAELVKGIRFRLP